MRSERQLIERLQFDLLFRWFVGLGLDDAVWDHSVFSKNRDRLLDGDPAAIMLSRFTRLTNRHSKKFERHLYGALYTFGYNFARINSAGKMAPAMAARVCSRLWEMADIVALVDAREEFPSALLPIGREAMKFQTEPVCDRPISAALLNLL